MTTPQTADRSESTENLDMLRSSPAFADDDDWEPEPDPDNYYVELRRELMEPFAQRYGLLIRRDSCGYPVCSAARKRKQRVEDASLIYFFGFGTLGLVLLLGDQRAWRTARDRCKRAGMTVRIDADGEGILTFSPDDPAQCDLAVELADPVRLPPAKAQSATFRPKQAKTA